MFLEKGRRKGGERARVCKRSSFGVISSPLLAPKGSNTIQEEIGRGSR